MKNFIIKYIFTTIFIILMITFGYNITKCQNPRCFDGNIVYGTSTLDCHDGTQDVLSTSWQYQIVGANAVNLTFWCTSFCRSNLPGYKFGPAPGDIRAAIQNEIAHLLTDAYPTDLYENTPETVHLYLPECWILSFGDDKAPPPRCTGLVPCTDPPNCCEQDYIRTKDANGNITAMKSTIVTTNTDICNAGCTNVCSATNYWPETVTYLQSTSSFTYTASARIGTEDLYNTNNSIIINPNPAQDHVNIIFSNTSNGNVIIMINDLSGISVSNISQSKKSQQITYDVNTSNYPNGKYFIQLYLEGKFIGSSSFLINK